MSEPVRGTINNVNCDSRCEFPNWNHTHGAGLFNGIPAQQNKNFYDAFKRLFAQESISRVLEIGTAEGGFTYALRAITDVPIVSYDIFEGKWHHLLTEQNIEVKHMNCWDDIEFIANYIQQEGQTLVCVDGGNKIREFNDLSLYCKSGDIIMAHDYHHTKESDTRKSVWRWCEISYADIQNTVEDLGLIDMCEQFNDCAWACWKRP